ncbi:hypothetical protein GCM10010464_29330 [Pseudonocardia yunnanensis]|uniref:Transposase n=1 Tax=Pseudonocardia yunnanensis TaxID=58107 RepID=A0ABW4F0C3_9PSEU
MAGYTGRAATDRGHDVAAEACWSLAQFQELLDEWLVAGWQARLHEGLVGPDTGRRLSPNEMYVDAAGDNQASGEATQEPGNTDDEMGVVIPFWVFDAHAEARRWP